MASLRSTSRLQRAWHHLSMQIEVWPGYITRQRGLLQGAPVQASDALAVLLHFESTIALMGQWAAIPGMVAYIRNQASDQIFDPIADLQAIRNAMISGRDQLSVLIPDRTPAVVQSQTFTAAQMAPIVAVLDGVITILA